MVRGRNEIVHALLDLLARARSSLAWTDTPPYLAGFDPDLERVELEALERGVPVRVLYDATVLDDAVHVDSAATMAAAGQRSRLAPDIHTKLVLVDGTTAVLPLARTQTYGEAHAVIVHHSALTSALAQLFEMLWRGAAPAPWSREVPTTNALTEEERRILQLMGAGLADAAIARHLGTTERTLRRRVEALRATTGSLNRFQLGVHAQRAGWL